MSHHNGRVNGVNGATGELEEMQNGQNSNWPFSVRYTASPYRKSKSPSMMHSPSSMDPTGLHNLNSPILLQTGVGVRSHHWAHGTPGHFLHHKHNQYVSHTNHHPVPVHLGMESSTTGVPSNYNNFHHQQFHLQTALASQNHFMDLKQHQEQQQHLIHHRQRQYDHHHYGLPLNVSALPPEVILQASQATINKTLGFEDQHLGVDVNNANHTHSANVGRYGFDNPHFRIRYPTSIGRKRVFKLNNCNNLEQVEGLDEGYIEDLKQPVQFHSHSSCETASEIISSSVGHVQMTNDPGQVASGAPTNTNPSGFDPYSYVYDSHLIKEDLSVCSASVNQVFLNKPIFPPQHQHHPPEGYSYKYDGRGQRAKVTTLENEYEEIRDVQRYMNMSNFDKVLEEEADLNANDDNKDDGCGSENKNKNSEEINNAVMGPLPPKHFKSFSTSTDDILAEVVQVRQKHDRVLDQLNLEVENLLIKSSVEIAHEKEVLQHQHHLITCTETCGSTCTSNFSKTFNPSGNIGLDKDQEGSGSYSTLLITKEPFVPGNNGNVNLGFTSLGSFGRKSKQDRGHLNGQRAMGDFRDGGNSGTLEKCKMNESSKMQDVHLEQSEEILCGGGGMGPKVKKYQRSMSLIPNWKIRDHLMRLPFLRHHHDKLKKAEVGRATIPHSISGGDFPALQNNHHESIVSTKLQNTNTNMSTVTEQDQQTPSAFKTRSSSMDELRSTAGEEHWYSADSDTEPDSLTAIPPLPPAHSPPADQAISTVNITLNVANSVDKVNFCAPNQNKASGNIYSNGSECNGSRMDVAIGTIPDVPKAPKFRRPIGLKDKWRESWSSHSKTLVKSSSMEEENRLLRWFSLRKNSANLDPSNGSNRHSTLPQLSEEDLKRISFMEDEEGYWPRRTVQPPSLPPPPPDLSGDQITRRHIVAAIVHSENSYVAALQRLVNEYKKPLECSHPAILSHSKISAVFHRVPEILQCHSLFRIALAECVRKWDSEEKIGDVFVASFSKSLVLDVYSEFINNFGTAMETAKMEARRKSAFAEFLKVKQMTAHDRLSLFGLMVKPVQRFPQFILLLQDLLKHTPKDHHDRMSLQLALTQLESLAAMLNERKRESEQYQAFRETIKSIGGGKFVLLRSIVDDPNRILLRQDMVTQLEFDSNGGTVAKSKCRKLLLLNDMLICTTASGSSTSSNDNRPLSRKDSCDDDGGSSRRKSEKSMFKWSYPVRDVDVEDISISPTMSRFVHRGSSANISTAVHSATSQTNRSSNSQPTEEFTSITLLEEMQGLMYDYEVLSRVLGLVSTLKSSYDGLTVSSVKDLMLEIQHQIRCRDEQISYFDSSCLTLLLGSGNNREKVVFQMQSPQARTAWIEELRLAQLALDPNNSPAWDIPQESPYPLHKLPLFVKAVPLSKMPHLTVVKCGCFFTHTFVSQTGRSKILDYLWVSSTDGMSSHLTAYRSQQNTLKEVSSLDLVEEKVNDMIFILGHIWVGTESRKIMLYDPADTEKGPICQQILTDSVLKLLYYNNTVYTGLADGHLAIFTDLESPEKLCPEILLQLGSEKIISLFGSKELVYAACGNSIVTVNTNTHIIEKSVTLNHHNGSISHMTCSGVGLWITTQDSETVCLYHLESFQHLQDVSIRPSVYRTVRDSYRRSKGVCVTSLIAHKGWLWIGTNLGVILTIPLPRLEGVPIISTGNANVSYHGFCGPVTFLMPLMKSVQPQQPSLLPAIKNSSAPPITTKDNHISINDPRSDHKAAEVKQDLDQSLELNSTCNENNPPSTPDSHNVTTNSISTPLSIEVDVVDKANNETEKPELVNGVKDTLGDSLMRNGIMRSKDTNSSASSIENSSPSPSSSGVSTNKTLVVLRKKSSKDNVFLRNCKTLPRGGPLPSNLRFSIDSDVYGLYGNLINVRGLEDEGRFVDPLYDALRRSDPELNSLDSKVSTLDRRVKMRMSRPRSLDLSNWSVDSKISASSDESCGGIGSMRSSRISDFLHPTSDSSPTPPVNEIDAKCPDTPKTAPGTTGRKHGTRQKAKTQAGQERTVLVVVGGRGYLNMRAMAQEHYISTTDSETKSCPHLTLWQMKT